MGSPAYGILTQLEAEELQSLCLNVPVTHKAAANADAINLAHSGFGIASTAKIGTSAGMLTAAMDEDVGFAASRSASEAVTLITRQKRLKTH